MELTEKDLLEIQKYKNGLMTDGEKYAFEERMQQDTAFKLNVSQFTGTLSALETLRQKQSILYLRELEASMPQNIEPLKKINLWKIAASILILISLSWGIWKYMGYQAHKEEKLNQPNKAIAAVFEPYPALGFTKGATTANKRKEAMMDYANNAFTTAIPKLEIVFSESKDSILLFYQAIAHLAIGEEIKALPIFEKLATTTNVPVEATQFYLALSYIAVGQRENAMPLLKKVVEMGGRYEEKALEAMK